MTKKHYSAIAKIIKRATVFDDSMKSGDDLISKQEVTYALCDYFKSENVNFNEEKFIDACKKD